MELISLKQKYLRICNRAFPFLLSGKVDLSYFAERTSGYIIYTLKAPFSIYSQEILDLVDQAIANFPEAKKFLESQFKHPKSYFHVSLTSFKPNIEHKDHSVINEVVHDLNLAIRRNSKIEFIVDQFIISEGALMLGLSPTSNISEIREKANDSIRNNNAIRLVPADSSHITLFRFKSPPNIKELKELYSLCELVFPKIQYSVDKLTLNSIEYCDKSLRNENLVASFDLTSEDVSTGTQVIHFVNA